MVVVNCAALPEALLESEFFGHERGAFTGAIARRIGKFQQASDGTIFLDEVGELPAHTQAKLLRVLQQREFTPLGSNETVSADVRIIVATNRNLEAAMAAGHFREDLFHRLSVVALLLPTLRDREDDISLLAGYFLRRFGEDLGNAPELERSARQRLLAHHWPGNVRELENCVQRLTIVCQGRPIGDEDVKQAIQTSGSPTNHEGDELILIRNLVASHLSSFAAREAPGLLERVERELLIEALRRARGNQTMAAKLVGMPRSTLYARFQKLGLSDHVADSTR